VNRSHPFATPQSPQLAQTHYAIYLYCPDVPTYHARLLAQGVSAGAIAYPFYAPRGEFPVTDPDNYALMISHT
jgi:hypothetical protein